MVANIGTNIWYRYPFERLMINRCRYLHNFEIFSYGYGTIGVKPIRRSVVLGEWFQFRVWIGFT